MINLSSINAYTGMPNTAVYAASKAALNSLTRTAAYELAPRKIRVNSVNPGPTNTAIFGKLGMPDEAIQEFASAMQNRIPLKRFGEPEDVATLVAFLASDEAGFIATELLRETNRIQRALAKATCIALRGASRTPCN